MKKWMALLLAMLMVFALCACGSAAVQDTPTPTPEATVLASADVPETPEETEEVPVAQALDFKESNTLGEIAELTFVNAFSTEELTPPMVAGVHITYTPSEGKVYLVLSGLLTNTTSSGANVDDLLTAAIAPVGSETYTGASYYGVSDGGAELDRNPVIEPLTSQEIYFTFGVPQGAEGNDYQLLIKDKDGGVYTGEFNVSQYEDSKPEIKVGDVIADDTIELTIDDVYFANSLYPPKMSGYYHYYEAESGKTYLIVKVTATNLKGNDMKYDSIAGVSCTYREKYNYTSFCALEKDGGTDLNGYPSQYAIAPLDKGTCYYLMEVPETVQEGPVTVSLYAAGQYYKLNVG